MSGNIGTLNAPTPHSDRNEIRVPELRNILGVDVCAVTRDAAYKEIERTIRSKKHRKYAFLNAHGANIAFHDTEYRSILKNFLVLSDGIGVDLGSKILYGEKFPANLNGTDFIPGLLSHLTEPAHIVLLGARAGVAAAAVARLSQNYPHHRFTVASDGYFDDQGEQTFTGNLRSDPADVLLVALGNPIQERWIAEKCNDDMAHVAIGVGALFDFMAHMVPRAPIPMRRLRLEWIYRLFLEPKRMWRRYLVGNPLFLMRVLRQKISGKSRMQTDG